MLVLHQLGFYTALIAVSFASAVVLLRQYLRGALLGDAPATCFRPRPRSRHAAIVVRSRVRATARQAHRRSAAHHRAGPLRASP